MASFRFCGATSFLHADPRGCFIDQIDGFVGHKAIGDVSFGHFRRSFDRGVGDAEAMVLLVPLPETFEDKDCLFDRRPRTVIGWKRRSSAASRSMYFRYSSRVVAPMV